ncbi:MAG: MGH1-like glycoside hydrolase domain-containing protein, partial [bacterium]
MRRGGAAALGLLVLVARQAPALDAPPFALGPSRETTWSTGDPALDGLQDYLRPTLEANRKEFTGRSGEVKAFGAGTTYPQVWIRDSATLVPLSRHYYPREFLVSWILEHLAHQGPDGLLNDWVAVGEPARFRNDAPRVREVLRRPGLVMSADRNTSSADQESALVDAVAQVTALSGDTRWLKERVAGRPVIDRVDQALGALYDARYDPGQGLLVTAFTADWGDVTPAHGDQRVIYLDDSTPLVTGLYVNAYFVGAARSLSDLQQRLGHADRAQLWTARAEAMAAVVNARFWQEARGFYRIHLPVKGPPGFSFPDEAGRFALGGNALAVISGIASDRQAARIFAAAEE